MRVGGASEEAEAAEAVEFGVGHVGGDGQSGQLLYVHTVVQNPRIARGPRAGVRGEATGGWLHLPVGAAIRPP